MRWLGFLLGVAGCFSPSPPAGAPCPDGVCPSGLVCSTASMTCEKRDVDAAERDAAIDGPPATPDGCFGSGLVVVCPNAPVTGTLVIANQTALNTTTSPVCLPYHLPSGAADTTYCVIGATTVTVSPPGRWLVTGTRPLVVIGAQVSIDGLVDVASHRNGQTGPNANPTACVAGTLPGNDAGGAGGSFGTLGGLGGASEDAPRVAPGPATPKPLALRGGCGGSTGGTNGGGGGTGGGALHIIATQLGITGTINASGEAGDGAGLSAGGGGGGSGGMIVLEAPQIVVGAMARIFANGGGGGEGGGPSNGGNDGVDSPAPMTIGAGGAGNAGSGGDGGDGAGTTPAASGADGDDAGGGGGGGAGVIRVIPAQVLGGSISPPPTT